MWLHIGWQDNVHTYMYIYVHVCMAVAVTCLYIDLIHNGVARGQTLVSYTVNHLQTCKAYTCLQTLTSGQSVKCTLSCSQSIRLRTSFCECTCIYLYLYLIVYTCIYTWNITCIHVHAHRDNIQHIYMWLYELWPRVIGLKQQWGIANTLQHTPFVGKNPLDETVH